jgi:PAS domain-containing protein
MAEESTVEKVQKDIEDPDRETAVSRRPSPRKARVGAGEEAQLQAELESLIRRAISYRTGESPPYSDAGSGEDVLSAIDFDLDDQRFYRDFIDKSNDAMYIVDLLGNLKFVNQTAARIMGYTKEELLGRNFSSFLYPSGISVTGHEKLYQ